MPTLGGSVPGGGNSEIPLGTTPGGGGGGGTSAAGTAPCAGDGAGAGGGGRAVARGTGPPGARTTGAGATTCATRAGSGGGDAGSDEATSRASPISVAASSPSASEASQTLLRTPGRSTTLTPSVSSRVLPGSVGVLLRVPERSERGMDIAASSPRASYDGADPPGNGTAALLPAWRLAIGACLGIAGASVPLLLAATLLATDPPMTPRALLELFAVQIALPLAAAGVAWRARRATVAVEGDRLVVERAERRLEVPLAAITRLEPWRVPLPAPGFTVRLRSGRRLPEAIAAADPAPLLRALAGAGVQGAAAMADGALASWAHVRAPWRRRWRHRLAKFPLFALAPAAVLFYTHQHIAYGGLFGEWTLLGRAAWLRTLALHWSTAAIYLLLYAAVLRGLAEPAALLAARVAPPRAAGVRRGLERACQVAYFAGVPALLGARYLA
jgi:hypothetical protein